MAQQDLKTGVQIEDGHTSPDWSMFEYGAHYIVWRNEFGDLLTLAVQDLEADLPSLSDEDAVRRYCRKFAESLESGLVEATTTTSPKSPAIKLIYKKLQKPAFKFTGQLITPLPNAECIWTIVAREQGTTGIREALITSDLMKKGKLDLESYKASWAQDP